MSTDAVAGLDAATRAVAERRHVSERLTQLDSRLAVAEGRVAQARSTLSDQEADIARAERISPTRLWAVVKGSRDGDLARERAEVDRARHEVARAQADLDRLHREADGLRASRDALGDVDGTYERALAEVVAGGATDPRLRGLADDARLRLDRIVERRKVEEALAAGQAARTSLAAARQTLRKAEEWSRLGMWSGSDVISSWMKHRRLRQVTEELPVASGDLERFSRALGGVDLPGVDAPAVDGLTRGIDTLLDTIIADLFVRRRIKDTAAQLDTAIEWVTSAIEEVEQRRDRLPD